LLDKVLNLIPPAAGRLALVLFLSFLIGLEREELKRGGRHTFGGVRTFPIIGLVGYALAFIAHGQVLPIMLGFGVVAGFLFLSYWHKLSTSVEAGMTTELSGLVVYLAAVLIYSDYLWLAATLIVACLLLLELKAYLEGLGEFISAEEALTFTKFLLLSAVILPIVPNADLGRFHLNPFKTWLVVLAVSGVSYGSYLLQRLIKGTHGTFLSAILGGIYSSTATTVALAKRAASGQEPHVYAGGILAASGVMYFRVVALVWIFNRQLALVVAPWLLVFAFLAILGGWLWSRQGDPSAVTPLEPVRESHNPLELKAAFFFAMLFLVMMVATHLATAHLGKGGIFSLAAIMGIADVDPFIMGLTQAGGSTTLHLAAVGIVVATASNNLVKGGYAWFFAKKAPVTSKWSFILLAGLALLGLLPLGWI
jgi:uncharacterized membrane protein (DUF4010 family)